MLFTLEPLPAAEGDCLLLHWGTAAQPKLAVIDGGPGTIWETSLLPRLEEIVDSRDLKQLEIDLVIVSHVDNDHIVGVKKLFRRLKTEIVQALPASHRLFAVKRLWHNTFNDVLDDAIDSYYQTLTAGLQANVGGAPNPLLEASLAQAYQDRHGTGAEEAADVAHDVALILAGHGEARELRDSHAFLSNAGQIAPLNSPFEKNGQPTLITTEGNSAPLVFTGLTMKVIGPQEAEIKALQAEFDAFIQARGLTVEAMLAAYSDTSVPNLSSIVCLVEKDGKRILLTGDARGDKIRKGLEDADLLVGGKLFVDVLKVPHHGSDRNLAKDFFDMVVADTYVLSGNGKHGNPERVTLEWLTGSRKPDHKYTIVLTYPVAEIDIGRKKDALQHHRSWVPAEHSLASLVTELRLQGHQFTLVEGAPFKIELGDETADW
jgi:beta-lactamase superfamily II metal-dependent hydrolase